MGKEGYIYILSNPSQKNLVKIGKTTREPDERANELSKGTGVPTPYIVIYKELFSNCDLAEKEIHKYLQTTGNRNTPNREFFSMPIETAIGVVEQFKVKLDGVNQRDKSIIDCNELKVYIRIRDCVKDIYPTDAIRLMIQLLEYAKKYQRVHEDYYFDKKHLEELSRKLKICDSEIWESKHYLELAASKYKKDKELHSKCYVNLAIPSAQIELSIAEVATLNDILTICLNKYDCLSENFIMTYSREKNFENIINLKNTLESKMSRAILSRLSNIKT